VISRGADKSKKEEFDMLKKIREWLVTEKKAIRLGDWSLKEIEYLNTLQFLTAKPLIYLVNLTEQDYINKENKWLPKIKKWVDQQGTGDLIIPFSVAYEENHANKEASALPEIIVVGYKCLQLHYFFTAGADEVRAWTIRKNTKAPQAAGTIHSDFERGFIMAEVMKFKDLEQLGSEAAVKAAGKYYQKGKEYVVEDGDVIFFKFNVTTSAKKK
jgi:obg-like ATPase 1